MNERNILNKINGNSKYLNFSISAANLGIKSNDERDFFDGILLDGYKSYFWSNIIEQIDAYIKSSDNKITGSTIAIRVNSGNEIVESIDMISHNELSAKEKEQNLKIYVKLIQVGSQIILDEVNKVRSH